MRKNWIWGLSLLLIGGMASCKSSQSAYKAAYERWKAVLKKELK